MRNIFILLVSICFFGKLSADIAVKSFRKLESDMTARIDAPKKDQNGDVCAIVKVVTTQTGFIWEPDGLGIVSAENKGAEYWLYVPFGAKRITIKHPQLGVLRDYLYPMSIEKATVYEMVLTTGRVTTIVEETIESQWLVITPEPADASVYIDDVYINKGIYQSKLKSGNYNYRVEAPMHHPQMGIIQITNKKEELKIRLKPNFGYIWITSLPENGAQVLIDDKPVSSLTPMSTEALKSGEYTVKVIKEMYQPFIKKVTVFDEKTTTVEAQLQPNFAELTVNAPESASIYINNQLKGKGTWKGRLSAGIFTLEARLNQHRDARQDIELKIGENRSISLNPVPIYGSLDVISKPPGATITIDGKNYGTTPNTINRLLIGDYTVQLNRQGFAPVSKTISIGEGKSAMINETLINGREVTINSTPSGVNLFVDGNVVGKTPYTANLTFGSHVLKIESAGKTAERRVEIAQTGGESSFTLTFGPASFTETVKGVSFEMIAIKGGTFQMGSNEGESDEKPVHQVTVSDFMMGKTEVTQALWQAVMGSNPSNFKGNNLPVESVSWNDCQEFIQKLNQLTGKRYRLPTEAEWEYAAGGGATNRTKWAGTNNESTLREYAWYVANSGSKTKPVGTKKPNALGLFDMSGNVWEWCSDWYGTYSSSAHTNPTGTSYGSDRVNRGGGWSGNAGNCRTADRSGDDPGFGSNGLGFRLVVDLVLTIENEGKTTGLKTKTTEANQKTIPNDANNSASGALIMKDKTLIETVKGVSFEIIAIKGGTFQMGSNEGGSDEKPLRQVTVSDFMMGKTEVTQALWQAVMGSNPSNFKGNNLPVESVSWNDCQEFIKKLNQLTGKKYRLPTEAEWEYAAGGGATNRTKWAGTNSESSLGEYAWYGSKIRGKTQAVGTKKPNALGLYDMSGNVWEWCSDWYGTYSSSAQTNPTGPSSGSNRVFRGGSNTLIAYYSQAAYRNNNSPDIRLIILGFRLVLDQ